MNDAASAVVVAAVEGHTMTPAEERFFREESPAGVTLFRRNIPQDAYEGVKNLNQALQLTRKTGAPSLMIAVDQEGGRVSRFPKSFPDLGPALYLEAGRCDEQALRAIEAYGQLVGRSLRNLGFNVDFAPVLDILTEPSNTAIGDRVFGYSADQVTHRARSFLKGLQSQKVAGSLKHFPGQGDAAADTHLGSARIDISLQTLWGRELAPFLAMINDAPMVMVSHCIFPVLCEKEASRSTIIINDWLRGRLGFRGVVVSDDLNMGALPQQISQWQEILVECVVAGCDALLVCRHLDRCYAALEALRRESAKSPAFRVRLNDAAERVTALRWKL
ncbi:MAG: hypothetical protein NTV34_07135 [Proteobacteria bacterium]|nr:hypothetical protein [Pseudomonadota bacterium]